MQEAQNAGELTIHIQTLQEVYAQKLGYGVCNRCQKQTNV